MRELCLIFFIAYGVLLGMTVLFGVKDRNLNYLGDCNKPSTYLGHYTGFAQAYDLGCKLGRRME
jgi:hypothetical protein